MSILDAGEFGRFIEGILFVFFIWFTGTRLTLFYGDRFTIGDWVTEVELRPGLGFRIFVAKSGFLKS